jgi:gluconokinase
LGKQTLKNTIITFFTAVNPTYLWNMSKVIFIMGVSGCGKTTIGKALAEQLHFSFMEADDFHPLANKDKMQQGIPLTDTDRWPWLKSLRAAMELTFPNGVVVACSALKESYRSVLEENLNPLHVQWVYLEGTVETLRQRLEQRKGHFMNPNLLPSQLATLEVPAAALQFSITMPPPTIIRQIIQKIHEA